MHFFRAIRRTRPPHPYRIACICRRCKVEGYRRKGAARGPLAMGQRYGYPGPTGHGHAVRAFNKGAPNRYPRDGAL